MSVVLETNLPGTVGKRQGKVRDVYTLADGRLLLVTSDRISAFDVVMNEGIPGKGAILTRVSAHWFSQTRHIIDNHLISTAVEDFPAELQPSADVLRGRSMLVQRTTPFPVECVVRAYLAGSGWKEYRDTGAICGVALPPGLQNGSRLPEPIFTPATKAEDGDHDENITFDQAAEAVGSAETMALLRDTTLKLFNFVSGELARKGLLLADTKLEFGRRDDGVILLIDEAFTPDSSRMWLADDYKPGAEQTNFDKQVLRDYLETLDWNKKAPAPALPADVIDRTVERYRHVEQLILGNRPD